MSVHNVGDSTVMAPQFLSSFSLDSGEASVQHSGLVSVYSLKFEYRTTLSFCIRYVMMLDF